MTKEEQEWWERDDDAKAVAEAVIKIIIFYARGLIGEEQFLDEWMKVGKAIVKSKKDRQQKNKALGVDLSKYFEGE